MANNPYVNKVVFGNITLIDTSGVTVTPDKLAEGYTALDASGALITGTAKPGAQYDTLTVVDGDWGIYFWGIADDGAKDQYHVFPGSSINVLHNSMFMVGPDDGNKLLRYSSTPSYITVNGYNISVNSAYPYKVNWNNSTKVLYYPNIMFSNGDLTITVENAGDPE